MTATATLSATTVTKPDPRRWAALLVILAADILDLVDSLVTGIAGPSIMRDLHGDVTLIQWLGAAYTLAMAGGLLVGGRLGDIVGRATVFRIGMAGFVLASVACALAPNPAALIAFRVAQGAFGAVMLPQGLGMIKEMFPPAEMGKAFGLFGPIMGLSSVAGPTVGGWLVSANLFGWGWRAIFAVNVPLGAAALIASFAVLPASRRAAGQRLDVVGALIAATAMVALVYPLIQGREHGWPWWTGALLVTGVALFALLAAWERRCERTGRAALIMPTLFGKRAFVGGLATGLAFFGALTGTNLVFTLFVQFGLGYSPFRAGLAGVAQALGVMAGFGVAQPLQARRGGRATMLVGEVSGVLGLAALAATVAYAGDGMTAWILAPALLVVGAGMGIVMSPFFDLVLAGVDDAESGSASGTLTAVQQLAGAVGIAVLGTFFYHLLDASTAHSRVGAFRAAAWPCYLAAGAFLVVAAVLTTTLLPRDARHAAPASQG